MKKTFKFLFVLILLLFITSCDSPNETCELLGHEYEALVTKPTCENDGFTTYTCKYCKSSYVDDKVNAIGHEILAVEELLPTCENDGHTSGEKCTRCDYNTSVIIPALGHDVIIDEKVEPTCENTGLTKGEHCTRCDYKVAQEVIPALGHDIIIDEKVEPTCENTGLTKGEHCTRCDYKVAQEVIPALGHDIIIDEKVEPTCENTGLTSGEHCTRCDYIVAQEVIPALGHDIIIDEKVEPTCENTGLTKGEHCTKCDYKVAQEVIPALGHDIVIDEKVDPTCESDGLTSGEHCTRCDYKVEQEVIAKLEHQYDDWYTIINPTCDSEGKEEKKCINCVNTVSRDTRITGVDNKVLVSNPINIEFFKGKTLLTIGDSITCGVGLSDAQNEYYGKLVANALGMNVVNKGISGSVYCFGGNAKTNNTLTEDNVKDADIITIFLGINDFNHACKNGHAYGNPNYTSSNRSYYQVGNYESTDTSTLYGALKVWCENIEQLKLIKGFENKQFIIITPLISSWNASLGPKSWDQSKTNIHGHTLREYCTAIMRVYAEYGIPVFDANMLSGIYYNSSEDNNAVATGGDGVHINAEGHKILADSLVEFLLEGYTYENRELTNEIHEYNKITIDPTCTSNGYIKHICSKCYDVYLSDQINPLEHDIVIDQKVEPTCTLTGLTEGEHCTRCNYKIEQKTIDIIDHKYQNGICSICNISHPNMENLEGKVISIMSASTSTFKGYIPEADGFNLEHRPRYPQDNLFTDVKHTWWMQVISDFNAKLGINDSWAGSSISNISDTNNGDVGPDAAMASITRIKNLGSNGTPDLILFYGGRNDITKNYTIGTFDSSNAPTEVDLESYKWDSVVDAFICAILRIKYFYPNSELIIMLPNYNTNKSSSPKLDTLNNELEKICIYFNVKYLDLRELSDLTLHLPDGSHPDEIGMDMITDLVEKTVLEQTNFQKGENIVYNVKHNLTNSLAELHYYKGVSKNSVFEEKVIADIVTIIMNGINVTEMYYNDGLISIDDITGDIEITLTSSFNADGHLQKLPENICHKTNIWDILEPENLYYTANGWDLLETNLNVYSVTFNVNPGDKIWATSFLEKGINGFSGNATRMTWFSDTGLLKTLDRNTVYAEFIENGYITVPDGACSVNIPMSSTIDNNEIFILNKDHIYDNLVCVCCGYEVPYEEMTLQYDDHIDISNIEIELVDVNTSVITIDDKYLIASNIGSTKVYIDNKLYLITVEKAKINLVTIMGQSNAGNHFENSTSDITCSIGTAYLWGNGEGVNAKEPIDYTSSSKGFHTPLIAELYAQSVKAGNPVKNVLIWQEGITSKNGKSITYWASSVTNTSGTDATATMIKNCVNYFESNSDKYEIVGNGIYWIQGESDVSMDPVKYTSLFMAMWNDLKEAGAEYVAFLRVRKGVTYNDVGSEHKDLDYHGSLTAQLKMINDNSDMFLATSITENWIGEADAIHSVNINDYITMINTYGSNAIFTDKYNNDATISNGILTTTMKTLYGSNNRCHYGKFGAAIIGCDAAKNMYHALNNPEYKLVMADTSGMVDNKVILKQENENQFNLSYFKNNISFRAECGSNAGILEIKVFDDSLDITDQVTSSSLNSYGTIDIVKLREYFNIKIILTYKTTSNVDIITTLTIVNDMNVLNNISTSLIEQDISI